MDNFMKSPSERMKELIARMTLDHSYWGYLFARIRRIEKEDLPSIMGVAPTKDGVMQLFYKPSLVENTTNEVLKIILEHEGQHILNKHVCRLLRIISNEIDDESKQRKSMIWNIAADCAVNCMIDVPDEVMIGGVPWQVVKPKLYDLKDYKETEYYYYNLLKQDKEERKNGNKYGVTSLADDIDDHNEWYQITKEIADSGTLSRKIEGYVQGIVKESLNNFKGTRGTLPAAIQSLIDQTLAPPKLPYYQIIRKLVKGSRFSKFRRAFAKINRKRTYSFMIGNKGIPQICPFPGKARDVSFDIGILLDTSGSMSLDDISEGLSGVKNFIENDRHCKTTVIEVDAGIQKEYECKRISDIQFDIKGRGGTELYPGLERFKELNPDVVLVFTDGYCENVNSISRKELPKKIIWVITENGEISNVNRTGFVIKIGD